MNISYRWLRTIAPSIDEAPQELADRLGMLGAPIDELTELAAGLQDILIAQVTDVRPHPNADRLRLCTVEAGAEPLQVVCGAPNVEAGSFYPFAPIGASLPGGMQIRKAKLRGEVSEGMLCSAKELGLGRDQAGLLRLSGQWEPGSPLVASLELEDVRLVLDLTPNRPDLLSHVGVARELAPGGSADLRITPFSAEPPDLQVVSSTRQGSTAGVQITLADVEGCPRYMAAVLEGIEVRPSPEWLATRLRAIGVRPINNIVDATNYVLHELGQPLHAFDLDRLAGPEVLVRAARSGEVLTTLDGVERKLGGGELLIADRDVPIALAGVMGGEDSEVSPATSRILLECALFDSRRVRQTARAMGVSTDASHRFERGVDPELQPRALHRVIDLILSLSGGSVLQPAVDLYPAPATSVRLPVRPSRVQQVLGVELGAEEISDLLTPIGFVAETRGKDLLVQVPSYRPDVTREIDVIEEIARRKGYDTFESELSYARPTAVPEDDLLTLEHDLQELLAAWGCLEARTAAFAPAEDRRVPLLNPLSTEESHLRDRLTPGLLRRIEHNWSHGVKAVRLYEIGTVFSPGGSAVPDEELRLAAVLTGPAEPPHWSGPSRAWDVWDLKALLEEVGRLTGATIERAPSTKDELLDPTECFALVADGEVIGTAGLIAAQRIDAPAWADPVMAFEVVLRPRTATEPLRYKPLPAFPAVERDLALLVPTGRKADEVEKILRAKGDSLLHEAWPFDLYNGKGVPEGTRSIAWRLRFRHPERTLTDEEVDDAISAMLNALKEELGVDRR